MWARRGEFMAKIPSRRFPKSKRKIPSRKFPTSGRKIPSRQFAKGAATSSFPRLANASGDIPPDAEPRPEQLTNEQARQHRLASLLGRLKVVRPASRL
jgi:hypothetical protein